MRHDLTHDIERLFQKAVQNPNRAANRPNSSSITARLQDTYNKATRVKEGKAIKKSQDWNNLQDIEQHFNMKRQSFEQEFKATYEDRLNKAREIESLRRQQKKPELKPRFAGDVESVDMVARREVKLERDSGRLQIDEAQERAIENLMHRAPQRGRARTAFNQTADRRRGQDRRHNTGPKRNR